jgi:hypothetical protein
MGPKTKGCFNNKTSGSANVQMVNSSDLLNESTCPFLYQSDKCRQGKCPYRKGGIEKPSDKAWIKQRDTAVIGALQVIVQ